MQVIQHNAHESLHWSWNASDHEWNTKIIIKYNIVCYKFYNNLKYEILEYKKSSPWEILTITKLGW